MAHSLRLSGCLVRLVRQRGQERRHLRLILVWRDLERLAGGDARHDLCQGGRQRVPIEMALGYERADVSEVGGPATCDLGEGSRDRIEGIDVEAAPKARE